MKGRRDYRSVGVMREGAERAAARRGSVDHEYVVGGFRLDAGRVVLVAVEMGPAYDLRETLTADVSRFARWRTKQAAWAWLQLRPWLADQVRVIHLGRLDVLSTPRPAAGTLTGSQ